MWKISGVDSSSLDPVLEQSLNNSRAEQRKAEEWRKVKEQRKVEEWMKAEEQRSNTFLGA